jgi:hypothetical protein
MPAIASPGPDAEIVLTTTNGSAAWCRCCNRVEVVLGNAILALAFEDLDAVLDIIASFAPPDEAAGWPGPRCYVIRTEHDDGGYVFDAEEVEELRTLVLAARARMVAAAAGAAVGAAARPRFLH